MVLGVNDILSCTFSRKIQEKWGYEEMTLSFETDDNEEELCVWVVNTLSFDGANFETFDTREKALEFFHAQLVRFTV